MRLYVSTTLSTLRPWMPTATRMIMCCGRSAMRPSMRRRYERSRVLKPNWEGVRGVSRARHALLATFATYIVVLEIPVIDDGAIERLLVGHDGLVRLGADHGRILARLGVDPRVQVLDDLAKHLFRLLVQVGDGDPRREDRIVGVLGREVRRGLGGEVLREKRGGPSVGVGPDAPRIRDHSRRARRWSHRCAHPQQPSW